MIGPEDEDDDERADDTGWGDEEESPQALPIAAPVGQPAQPVVAQPAVAQAPHPAGSGWEPLPGAQPVAVHGSPQATLPGQQSQRGAGWEPAPGAQPVSIVGATSAPKGKAQGSLRDFGDQAWAGTLQIGEGLLSAVSLATRKLTENPDAVAWIEQQRRTLGDHVAATVQGMSPAAQQGFTAKLFGSGTDADGNHIPSPGEAGWAHYIGATVATFIPQAVLAVIPGSLAARATMKIVETLGTTVASRAATGAAAATTGTLFGAQQAGDAYQALVDQVDKAKPEELRGSPVYDHAIQQGMSDREARQLLVGQIAPPFAAMQFAVGAVAGAGTGQILTRGALGAATATTGRRAAIGAAEGAGTMGFQGGAGNVLEQAASMQAGTQKEFDTSKAATAFASGALGGILVGGGAGALHGRVEPPPASVAPDTHAAITEALQLDLPLDRAPPGFVEGSPQGELFRSAEDAQGAPRAPPPPPERPAPVPGALTFQPDRTQGPAQPWTSTGEGMIPGTPGFRVVPEGTPAPPPPLPEAPPPPPAGQLALPAPTRGLTFNPDRTQGAGFTVNSADVSRETSPPSGGLNRGNLIDELTKQGQSAQALRRMKIDELRATYDRLAQPAAHEFRPEASPVAAVPDIRPPADTHPVEEAAAKTVEPTPAQAEAGNYQKGHVRVQGLDVSIETPKGGVRRGPIDEKTGNPAWETTMPAHYGYIRGTVGGDGEHIDVTMGPRIKAVFDGTPADAAREPVFVVDQIDPKTGAFDEHKAFVGFHTAIEAAHAYDASFSDGSGPARRGAVTEQTFDKFKEWLKGDTSKALAYKKPTVGEQLAAKRQVQKQRMAEPVMALVKKSEAKPPAPEVRLDEEHEGSEAIPEGEAQERGDIRLAEEQPQVFEPPAGQRATVVNEQPAERQRSPLTTNKERILADLERKIAGGEMSAAEADKAYGRQERLGGRQRKYPDFASYLRERIEKAEDPRAQQDIIERAAALQTDKTLTVGQRVAAERALNEELKRTDPDYAQRLRDMLNELEDPVAKAAEDAARQQRQAERLSKIKGLSKPKTVLGMPVGHQLLTDPRINKPVRDLFLDTHKTGAGLHQYLDLIANDPVIKVRLPQYVALARQLRELAPDVPVFSMVGGAERFNDPSFVSEAHAGAFMRDEFDPAQDSIVLNMALARGGDSMVGTLLHEGLHSVTSRYIDALPKTSRDRLFLGELHDELSAALEQRQDMLTPEQWSSIQYALTSPHELHTMLMSDPVVQRFAAEALPSNAFRERMAELGIAERQPTSLWQSFTRWVRKVLGLPQAISDSVLDHALRPLQDIVDRASAYNRENLPEAPELRAVAEPLARVMHGLPDFGRVRDEVLDRIDPGRIGDRGRRTLVMAGTTDGLVKRYLELFPTEEGGNSLENWRAANEAIQARGTEFRTEYSPRVERILKGMDKLPGAEFDKLATLANEATIANARLGPGSTNVHQTRAADIAKLPGLQQRFAELSPEAKQLYVDVRDFKRETYEIERAAQLASMIKRGLPDATPEQVETLTEAARSQRSIRQLIDDPDASPVARAFAEAWDTKRALVRGIAQVHKLGFVRGDYFSLRRFGDYVIEYGTKGTDDYGVEFYERKNQAEARRAELDAAGAEPSQVVYKHEAGRKTTMPSGLADEIETAVRRAQGFTSDQAESVRDLFNSIALQHATHSEAARTRMRRQGIQGASTEMKRILAQDFLALSTRLGYLDHGPDRDAAMSEMQRRSKFLGRNGKPGEQIKALTLINELQRRQPSGDDASGVMSAMARHMNSFGYVYSLMSLSHMVTSTVEAHMNSAAMLGARHGYVRAGLALTKALKDIAPTMAAAGARNTLKSLRQGLKAADWNLSTLVRDRLIASGADRANTIDLFNRINNAGLIDHSVVREVQRMANPGRDFTLGWGGRLMDLVNAGAHAVDVLNKGAIAKAAYDLEFRKTGSHDLAAKYAVEKARDAMPNYNLGNKPRIATAQGPLGAWGGPVAQFKMYGLHMYSVMANLVHASIHGATPAEKMEARKAFAGLLATHALMAGSLTLIADPLRYIGGAYDFATGAANPHDYQNDMRSWMTATFGPELGEVVARGLPYAVGTDIHRRGGLANLLEVPELRSFDKKGFGEVMVAALTGASGEDAAAMIDSVGKLTRGDLWNGLKGLAPRIVRDPMKAAQLATQGVTDTKGRTILPPSKLTNYDIAAQAVGFQPSRVSEFREGRQAVLEAREESNSARSRAMNAFLTAAPDARTDTLAAIQAYNRSHPTSPITYAQLIRGVRDQQKQIQSSKTYGLRLPTKSAATLERAGAFANSR